MFIVASDDYDGEPSPAELAAIEGEWPVIEAELTLLDAEIAVLAAPRPVPALDWSRVRAAERAVISAWLGWLAGLPRTGREAA
jgi:hypothetical protein